MVLLIEVVSSIGQVVFASCSMVVRSGERSESNERDGTETELGQSPFGISRDG